jgi:hypothetical protein
MEVCVMGSADPSSFSLPWLAADGGLSAVELLATLGVVIWTSALVWVFIADAQHARSRHHERHGEPGGGFHLHHR